MKIILWIFYENTNDNVSIFFIMVVHYAEQNSAIKWLNNEINFYNNDTKSHPFTGVVIRCLTLLKLFYTYYII